MITVPCSVLLDAEAVSALASQSLRIYPWLAAVAQTGSTLYVSAATLAETTDGTARDANVRCVVASHAIVRPVDQQVGFSAGRLRAAASRGRKKPRDLTIDALVAATALTLQPPVIVLTADVGDFAALLEGAAVRVHSIN